MIDINKKYRTRDGREVRIYATDGGRANCMTHGAVKNGIGFWEIASWYTAHGKNYDTETDHPYDLIEVRPRHKRTVWLHVFKNGSVCATEESYYVLAGRIACIKVELDFEEGEGL
jgi:hypothetical protein